MRRMVLALLAVAAFVAGPALAADKVKIGLLTTLSGPEAVMGVPMRDSAVLALEMLGGKIGGLPAQLVFGDDQTKPDVGYQVAERMLREDKVDFITGMALSNVLLAVLPQIIKSKTIIVSANAGPPQIAGASCSPYFFNVGQNPGQGAEAMGKYLSDRHVEDVYVMAPNYSAGKENVRGFQRFFKGSVVGEVYTALNQLDYQAEITQIRGTNARAVFAFYPGAMGIQFVKQYAEAGLKERIPLYTVSALDEGNLPALKEVAIGDYGALYWSATLDVDRSRDYVAAFEKKFNYTPSSYGAGAFDAIFLIDSAVRAAQGNLADKEALIAALERADFPSVRGKFAFNTNHFPLQSYYLFQVAKTGEEYRWSTVAKIFETQKDPYYQDCVMKKP